MSQSVRWLLILLGIPVFVLVLAVILVPMLVPKEKVLALAAEAVREQSGLVLEVQGDAGFSLFPQFGIKLGAVSLVDPAESEPLFTARQLAIALQMQPLLSGRALVDAVLLDGVDVLVDQRSGAEQPEAAETPASAEPDTGPGDEPTSAPADTFEITIERVSITDSRLVLRQDDGDLVVSVPDFQVTQVNLNDQPVELSGTMNLTLPGEESPIMISLRGESRYAQDSQQLNLPSLTLEVAHPDYDDLALAIEGVVDAVAETAQLQLELDFGATHAEGSLAYDPAASPVIDANLALNRLDPLLVLLAGPAAADAPEEEVEAEEGGAEPLPLESLRAIDSRVRLTVASTEYEGHRVENLVVALRAKDGMINLRKLQATIHDGQLDATANIDATQARVRIISNGGLTQLDLDSVKRALDVDSAIGGSADLKWQVRTGGATVDDLVDGVVAELELALSGEQLNGGGTVKYNAAGSPQIDAKLLLSQLDPALLALAGPDAAAEAAEPEASAAGADDLPLELIRQIDTRADIGVGKARYEGYEVSNLRLKLRAVDGVVKVNTLTGKLYGGDMNIKANLDASQATAKLWSKGGLKGVDIAKLLQALGSEPLATGRVTLDWTINGRGNDPDAIMGSLNGPVKLRTVDVTMPDIGVEKMLCDAVAQVNQEALQARPATTTNFDQLSADVKLSAGVAQLKPFTAQIPHVGLRGEGTYRLDNGKFSATFAAKLDETIREVDPACRVNERLTAIEWPVDCKGNVSGEPADWCSVDTQDIIEDLAKNEAKRQVEKEAGKLLDKLINR